MKKYNIHYSNEAYDDLKNLFRYISFIQQEPIIARNIIKQIIEATNLLDIFPYKHPEMKYQTISARCLIVKKHIVFYSVDETNSVVNILRILSCKQDIYSHIKKN